MAARPGYFAAMKAEVGRIIDALSSKVATADSNARFLEGAGLQLDQDQAAAMHDLRASSEQAAALLRELQATILG